jgi:hypothetical protein
MQPRRVAVTAALFGTLAIGCESEVMEPLTPTTKQDPVVTSGDPPPTAHLEVRAGGQIREGDWKVSFGGQARADGDLESTAWMPWRWMAWEADGEWLVQFHDVPVAALNGSTFKSTDVMNISFGISNRPLTSCIAVAGVTAVGTLNGEPGWVIWFSMADGKNKSKQDLLRIVVWAPGDHPDGNLIAYDTDRDGFTREGACGKRTSLDAGNFTIDISW